MLFEAVLGPRLELLEIPMRPGYADDGHVEVAAPDQRLEGREYLLVRQVAGSAEEDEGVGAGSGRARFHVVLLSRSRS